MHLEVFAEEKEFNIVLLEISVSALNIPVYIHKNCCDALRAWDAAPTSMMPTPSALCICQKSFFNNAKDFALTVALYGKADTPNPKFQIVGLAEQSRIT